MDNGYTIIWRGTEVKLIEINGRTVNEWEAETEKTKDCIPRAKLIENGNTLSVTPPEDMGAQADYPLE